MVGSIFSFLGKTVFWIFTIGFIAGFYLSNQLTGYAVFKDDIKTLKNTTKEQFLSIEHFRTYKDNLFYNERDYNEITR